MDDDVRVIGKITKDVINVLQLDFLPGTPIYIGSSNEQHIKDRHPAEYDLYFSRIDEIIAHPDYVGLDPKKRSIDYVKIFQLGTEYVQVSVRVTAGGRCFARTLFLLSTYKAEKYIGQGSLKRIQSQDNDY